MHSVKFDVKCKDRTKGVGLNLQEGSEGGVNEGRVKLQWCLMDLGILGLVGIGEDLGNGTSIRAGKEWRLSWHNL